MDERMHRHGKRACAILIAPSQPPRCDYAIGTLRGTRGFRRTKRTRFLPRPLCDSLPRLPQPSPCLAFISMRIFGGISLSSTRMRAISRRLESRSLKLGRIQHSAHGMSLFYLYATKPHAWDAAESLVDTSQPCPIFFDVTHGIIARLGTMESLRHVLEI